MANVQIAQASIDEHKKAKGGQPGDQTGKETNIRDWYSGSNGGWSELIRCKDESVAKMAASVAVKLVQSNLVGYNQSNRNTLWNALNDNGWNVDKYISSRKTTETDCSALVFAAYCCVIPNLRNLRHNNGNWYNSPTCQSSWSVYKKCKNSSGESMFERYTEKKITQSKDYLKVGDMLNIPAHHIVIVCSVDGSVKVVDVPPANDVVTNNKKNVSSSSSNSPTGSVYRLDKVNKNEQKLWNEDDGKKNRYDALLNRLISETMVENEDIVAVNKEDFSSPSILKGDQISKKVVE